MAPWLRLPPAKIGKNQSRILSEPILNPLLHSIVLGEWGLRSKVFGMFSNQGSD